jgi:cytochrome P450
VMSVTHIDLSITDLFVDGDCHATFRWLREHAPLYWNEARDSESFWALTRYQDVVDVFLHPEIYSSAQGTILGGSYRNEVDTSSGQMLIATDPPRHRYLRHQVYRAGFAADMLERVREGVGRTLEAALDRLLADGGGDFTEVARALPAGVMAGMIGVGPDECRRLLGYTRTMMAHRDEAYRDELTSEEALVESHAAILDFFGDVVEERRRQPGDDLVSRLLTAEVNGVPITEAEVLYNCLNVAFGSNETTAHAACSGLLALLDNPEQERLLRTEPEVLGSAVEELLRYTSVSLYGKRTVMEPVVIRGQEIAAGETITVWTASANRDESVFPDSDRFDVRRRPNPHITFGIGRHHCIGSSIARVELTMLLRRLVERGVHLRLAGPVQRLHSNFLMGIRHLPVEVV